MGVREPVPPPTPDVPYYVAPPPAPPPPPPPPSVNPFAHSRSAIISGTQLAAARFSVAAMVAQRLVEAHGIEQYDMEVRLVSKSQHRDGDLTDREKLLGDALRRILVRVGVLNDVPLTGPELLAAAEDYLGASPPPGCGSGAMEALVRSGVDCLCSRGSAGGKADGSPTA